MDIYQAIQKRYSVRAYKSEAVPEESLNQVLEAGRLAPSAHNAQDYKFVVVKEAEKRKELAEAAAGQSFLAEAPVVIAAVSLNPEDTMSCGVPTYSVNLAIAVDHMTLAAVAEGLGTCWIGAFSQERVKEILGIPAKYKVVVLLPLGYPSDKPKEKSRKDLSELVCFDKFEENS